jgi:transmembrane sensor
MTRNVVDSKIRQEAELWFARRLESPDGDDAGCDEFERWREQDPRRAQAYANTVRLWESLAVLKRSGRLRRLATPISLENTSLIARRPRSWQRLLLLAASTAAVAIVATLRFTGGGDVRTFTTTIGQLRTEALSDGSVVRLNTNSTLDVRMTRKVRTVHLRGGEAAFDVAKDANRPFVVTVGDGTVTAVGTRFQVRDEGGAAIVTLMEGRVQLARASYNETESLEPGQQATVSTGQSGIVRQNVDVQAVIGWMSGRLEFRGARLAQAVAEANRYSARKIRIGDPSISTIEVSGTFRTADIDGVAVALEAAFPVRAEFHEAEIVLMPR